MLFREGWFASVRDCAAELGLAAYITATSLIVFKWNVGIRVFLIIALKIEMMMLTLRIMTMISKFVVIFFLNIFFALLLHLERNYSSRLLSLFYQVNKLYLLLLLLVWLLNSLLYASYERAINHFSITLSFFTTFADTTWMRYHFFNELLIVIMSTNDLLFLCVAGSYFHLIYSLTLLLHFRS